MNHFVYCNTIQSSLSHPTPQYPSTPWTPAQPTPPLSTSPQPTPPLSTPPQPTPPLPSPSCIYYPIPFQSTYQVISNKSELRTFFGNNTVYNLQFGIIYFLSFYKFKHNVSIPVTVPNGTKLVGELAEFTTYIPD